LSVARHHAEWLSLVESSGPFLSMPVLLRVFPQGLEQRDPAKAAELREAYEDWLERGAKQPAVHHAWIRHVLEKLLEYPAEFLAEGQAIPPGMEAVMANAGETLRPDFVLKHRDAGHKPLLLIEHYAPDQDLEKPIAGKLWKATPGTRMMELLHAADVPLGLITNGEQWMLVDAPRGETTGFASWYADLWMQEPITLRAFHSLLHLRRFLGVAEPETLAGLYAASSKDQQEVTDQLGYQVRQAVEMLVQAFDRIDAESERKLLAGVSEKALYDSALTIMMRLVFLFSADERGLLLLGDPLYDQHYAVSTLSELLRERADQHGEEVLERRHDAWCRLLATFRAVHAGVSHEAMRLPPYGGTLFDPDRYPFLEGRAPETKWQTTPAKPLPINNRVVLHLLEALQILRVKVPGGGPAEARRLSFRALDIEQIGHVYEGLLDHTAKRASEIILGLAGSKDSEPEISLFKLEEIAGKGTASLVEFLNEETGRSEKTLKRLIEEPPALDEHRLLIACGQDPRLTKRVKLFAALVREDSFGKLVVIPEGSVFVTAGSDRRSTGTHYTPRELTIPIVQHTLEPLVYNGVSEGRPPAPERLKSAREILALKVCDMTMGSGAFLVQTCRYLAERLVEAWEQAEQANPGKFLATPEGDFSEGDPKERLIPADSAERIAIARRYVADRCLYGVDINPMAVEMAKLSLWLITLQRDRPFTFLDHALKCGDSLLGVSSVQQIENFSLRPGERQVTFATANLFRYVEEASAKRRALADLPSNDYTHIETKNRLHAEAEAATAKVKALADCLIAFELGGLKGDEYEEQRAEEAEKMQLLIKRDADAGIETSNPKSELARIALESLRRRRPLHWSAEFPEVLTRGGFDAFVGNPPFMGSRQIAEMNGKDYATYLLTHTPEAHGNADLVAYFFRRVAVLTAEKRTTGLVATKSISESDTRNSSLTHLLNNGFSIFRADNAMPWPGQATVKYSVVFLFRGSWPRGFFSLNGKPVPTINSSLQPGEEVTPPTPLASLQRIAFIGAKILGQGFILKPEEQRALTKLNPLNSEIIMPYIGGDDISSSPSGESNRYVINFGCRTLEEARRWNELIAIVEQKVLPERMAAKDHPLGAHGKKYWWQFGSRVERLQAAIQNLERCLVISRVTKYVALRFCSTTNVFSEAVIVFAESSFSAFSFLQSSIHEAWSLERASFLGDTLRYTPTDCFETLATPPKWQSHPEMEKAGRAYSALRDQLFHSHGEGLTKTYNRFHDRGEQSADIARLRGLHVEMDQAVVAAYGWSDLDLGHGFHPTKQGMRYTISKFARRIVLDSLLDLNHQRFAEEVTAGLHDKGAKKSKKARQAPAQPSTERLLPSGFRFTVSDPATYAINLVVALLSEAGGSLPWQHLRDGFVFATRPALMKRYATRGDAQRVEAWAKRWNEKAVPKLLPASLKALGRKNLFIQPEGTDFVFQLPDGPKSPASEDVGYDAWLALRVSVRLNGKPAPLPESEQWIEDVRQLASAT
jgi:hypothetical protein